MAETQDDLERRERPAFEEWAKANGFVARIVGEYLNACRMSHRDQIGNYLMKLCSVAGVVMAQAEGSVTAYERPEGTARFILNNCPALPATLEKVQ